MRVKIFSMNDPMGKRSRSRGWRQPTEKRQNQEILEDEINQWLSQNKGVEVVRVEQSSSGGSFSPSLWMISVWYEESESQ